MSKKSTNNELIEEVERLRAQLAAARDTITSLESVSAWKRLEQQRLNSVMRSIPEGVYIVNPEYGIEYINPVLSRDFGPVNGRKCFQYLHGRTEPCPDCKNEDVFAGKSVRRKWHSGKNNKHYVIYDSPLENVHGTLDKLAFFHDATAVEQVTHALEKSQQLLDGIINNSTAVIQVKDIQGRYLMANTQFNALFNGDGHSIPGKSDTDFFPADQARVLRENDRKVLEENTVCQFEEILRHTDGDHVYISIKFPLVDSDDSVYAVAAISTDITERRRLEQRLRDELVARREAFEVVRQKNKEIEETNIALRVLLDQYKKADEDIQHRILIQLEKAVFPYIELLRQCRLDEHGKECLDMLSAHLRMVGDAFMQKLSNPGLGLTKREILVADLVRQGKSTKEIAKLLGLLPRSVEAYRNKIRKKLHLNKKNISLKQYLTSNFTS